MRTLLSLAFSLALSGAAVAETLARDAAGAAGTMAAASQAKDACGGRGVLDSLVPDGPFIAACKFHDACYRADVMDQGRCDTDFLADMRAACHTTYPSATAALEHGACQTAAWVYFRAVNSRFGAHEYSYGTTGGRLMTSWQTIASESDGSDELTACAGVKNLSNRVQHYRLFLETASGKRIGFAPVALPLRLQAGETGDLCVSTDRVPLLNASTVGETYTLILEGDDPDRFALGDQLELHRLACTRATGTCTDAAL